MGLNTRGGGNSNKTYLNVYQGNLVLEYNTEDDLINKLEELGLDESKIRERKRTKGKNEGKPVYYYVLYDVAGLMTNIKLHENDYGEFLEVEFTDVDEVFSVSLGDVSSRMAKDFTRRIGNLDLDKEVVFGVWNITAEEADNGKAKSGVRMYQDDEKIEYSIDWEQMPEPEQKKKGRKTVWDFTEQENFLYSELTDFMKTNFKDMEVDEKAPAKEEKATSTRSKRTAIKKEAVKDDLPF